MSFQALLKVLFSCNSILILCHHNADPDALGSATALSRLLKIYLPNTFVDVSAPCGISKMSRKIAHLLPTFSTSIGSLETKDAVILVDTNTLSQLDEFEPYLRNWDKPLVFIDHHAHRSEIDSKAALYIVDEASSSASEVVYDLYEQAGIEPDRESAQALFLGIAYDTRHFLLARSKTFTTMAKLINAGAVAEELLPALTTPAELSERIARLKAAQRMQCLFVGGWCVVYSRVGSYQASAARALIALGADIAIVGGERQGKLKISLRSSRNFYERSNVHLGRDIASKLGEFIHGSGGGHNSSAGFNGKGELEMAISCCLKLLHKALDEKDKG